MVKRCKKQSCLVIAKGEDDIVCTDCGGDLVEIEKWCPQCKESREWRYKFCAKCQTKLEKRVVEAGKGLEFKYIFFS